MADGYARIAGRPGVCMAQSVGAANLAAGLQDASRPQPGDRLQRPQGTGVPAPQCVPGNSARAALRGGDEVFQPGRIDVPRLLRQAWRAALAETSRPTHLDFNGLQGDVIELGQTHESTTIETEARGFRCTARWPMRATSSARRRS